MSFNKRVTTTKRNHIYYGPTESKKIATTLEEVDVDLENIYDQFDNQLDTFAAVASGYLTPSGQLRIMSSYISEMETIFEKSIYIQATTNSTF